MKIFIKKLPATATVYLFSDEAQRNEDRPREDERMAGVSARKVAEWHKTIDNFINIQEELMRLYEGEAN